jgi:putative transposase
MARPLRIEYPGAVYHITSRGNAQNDIFLGDEDRANFLEILSTTIDRCKWLCHAFCLMDNHYHLLIETIDPTLSKGMRQLNGVYTQSFNRRHDRAGHVFQGRYKAILVQKGGHLLELCRYVVINPVKANIAREPGDWKWSSYRGTAFDGHGPDWLTTKWILGIFSKENHSAKKSYRRFVTLGISRESSPWDRLKGQIFFGSEKFIHSIRSDHEATAGEVPKAQRYAKRISLEDLFKDTAKKKKRNKKIREAYLQSGYKMKEIADYLSIHYTTVSKIINQDKK